MTHSHIISSKIFDLCGTSSKQQCLDCNLYWEVGIVFCTCGRCLRISQSDKEVDKSNNDVVSIPGYVVKKNNKRGAKHGAGQRKHGGHSSILARWHNVTNSKKCYMTELLWRIIHHSHVAAKAERIRNSEHGILKLKQDGAQQP